MNVQRVVRMYTRMTKYVINVTQRLIGVINMDSRIQHHFDDLIEDRRFDHAPHKSSILIVKNYIEGLERENAELKRKICDMETTIANFKEKEEKRYRSL